MMLELSNDGSFSGAYPCLDGVPLRPRRVVVNGNHVTYELAVGRVEIECAEDVVRCRTRGIPAPGVVEPLGGLRLPDIDRWWHLGLGMAGGAGFGAPASDGVSHGLALFVGPKGSVGMHAADQSRHRLEVRVRDGRVSAGFVTEGLSGDLDLPEIRLTSSTAAPWEHARALAAAVAEGMGVRQPQPEPGGVWCSWYRHYHHFSHALLRETLDGLRSLPDRGGIRVVQIDAGACAALGDWRTPNDLWPDGLEPALREIREAGFVPGLWIGPFMVGNRSRLCREHPEWLLRLRDGSRVTPIRGYGEHRLWRYPDEEYYVLDTSHPEAAKHLRETVRTLVDWGVGYLKADFLQWGFHDDRNVLRAVRGPTATEHVRAAVALLREELGPDRYLLGCIAPYTPCLGLVDAMRIAGDVGPSWDNTHNPRNFLRESVGHAPLEGLWWRNDPDAILVRDTQTEFSEAEVFDLARWQAAVGSNRSTSDPLWTLPPARQALWREVLAAPLRLPQPWGGDGIVPVPRGGSVPPSP